MLTFFKEKISGITTILILLVSLSTVFSLKNWNNQDKVIEWDVVSYYAYLPAAFIYDDVSLKFLEDYKGHNKIKFWPGTAPNGGKYIKTSMGVSMMYAPFFFMGHFTALLLDEDAGGFSYPYKLFLMLSSVFYLTLGLYFLSKVLNMFFPKWITAITFIALVFGTNLFHYSAIHAPVSHVFSFCLFSIFMHLSIKWHEKQSIKLTVFLGLIYGLIVLIRPTNIIILFFLILLNVTSTQEFLTKISFFFKEWKKVIIIILCFLIVWLPQFLYWKHVTGDFIFWSYGEESFFFTNPKIYDGLFSYRNGWIIYSPILIFSLLGIIFFLGKSRKKFRIPILLFTAINIYIILSWWCWWYTGFGHRAFIDSYAILSLPLAGFFYWGLTNNKVVRLITVCLTVFLIWLGVNHTRRYSAGSIHYNSMTKRAYWECFGKVNNSNNYWKLLKTPDYNAALKGIEAYESKSIVSRFHYKKQIEDLYEKNLFQKKVIKSVYDYSFEDGIDDNVDDFKLTLSSYISNKEFFTGVQSIVTNEKSPEALKIEIQNVEKGEKFIASIWFKGFYKDPHIKVFSNKSFFNIEETVSLERKGSWEKLQLNFYVPETLKSPLEIIISNKGEEEMFFDNLKVKRYSFK